MTSWYAQSCSKRLLFPIWREYQIATQKRLTYETPKSRRYFCGSEKIASLEPFLSQAWKSPRFFFKKKVCNLVRGTEAGVISRRRPTQNWPLLFVIGRCDSLENILPLNLVKSSKLEHVILVIQCTTIKDLLQYI